MDRKRQIWGELAVTLVTAWMMLPEDSQRRVVAGALRAGASLSRGAAVQLGQAAIWCERQYYGVIRS